MELNCMPNSDLSTCSTSCTILDQILDYVFKRGSRPLGQHSNEPSEGDKWRDAIDLHPEILYDLLNTIFSKLLYEEANCLSSLSRPLYGLIILTATSGGYEQCKTEFICQHPVQLQQPLEQAFSRLMEEPEAENNVSLKNKDIFKQKLTIFTKEVDAILTSRSSIVNSEYFDTIGGQSSERLMWTQSMN